MKNFCVGSMFVGLLLGGILCLPWVFDYRTVEVEEILGGCILCANNGDLKEIKVSRVDTEVVCTNGATFTVVDGELRR